jgi:tetratricopeptide (TPR) repeat protein
MKKSYFIIYFLLGVFYFSNSFAQNKEVESLIHYLKTSRFIQCDSALKALRLNAVVYLKEDTNKIRILLTMVDCIAHMGPMDTAKKYANELTALSDKLNYKRGNSYWLAATLEGGTPEAIRDFLATIKIAEETKDTPMLVVAYARLGLEYHMARNYPAAVEAYFKRLKLANEDGYKQIPTLQNLSLVYKDQKKYDEALKIMQGNIRTNYRRLEEISSRKHTNEEERNIKSVDSMETLKQIATDKMNAAGVYSSKHQFEEAAKYFREVINDPDMNRFGNFNGVGYYPMMSHNFLAELYLTQILKEIKKTGEPRSDLSNEFDSAVKYIQLFVTKWKDYYHLSSKDATHPGVKALSSCANAFWGRYFYAKALISSGAPAIAFFDSSLKYLIDTAGKTGHADWYGLSKVYESKSDYKNAFKYSTLYYRDRDSTMNNETNNRIEQLRIQYEVESAITKEKVEKEKEFIAETARHERALLEENNRHQTAMAAQKLKQEQLLSQQKLKDAQVLANETAKLQRIEADEKLRHERTLYQEEIRHQTIVAEQKRTQDKILSQKEKRNNEILMGSGVLFLTTLFALLFIRQRSAKKRAIEKAESLHKMSELELQSLRAQLNPHFMFNSLNAIQELVLTEDNERSHIYLSAFADLLRLLLDNATQPFIPLKKEIEFLQLYLSLENLRIPNLQYAIHVDEDVSAQNISIPNMILQPYIENAIWHGLSHKKEDRKLSIDVYQRQNSLIFRIQDNGVGRKKAAELKSLYRTQHQSKGMELLSKRFSLLSKEYATEIKTRVTDLYAGEQPSGTLVEVLVPLTLSEKFKEAAYDSYNYN